MCNIARNLATVRCTVLQILQVAKSRKGGIRDWRLVAIAGNPYREQLLG